MPRPYSDKFLLGLNHADSDNLGVQLAKICVKSNLPTMYVADSFNVSRMSIHNWFRGNYIRQKNIKKIEKFINLIEEGLADGILPAINFPEAREYLESAVKIKLERN